MKRCSLLFAAGLLSVVIGFSAVLSSEGENTDGQGTRKAVTNDHAVPFLINRVFGYYQNNGKGSFNPYTLNSGFEFPKGENSTLIDYPTAKMLVFCDGILWGGFHRGVLRVGGSHYNSALQAGRIITPGSGASGPVASQPGLASNRVYRVRRDITPQTPFSSASTMIRNEELPLIARYVSTTEQQIYDQYVADWKEWPASEGAPFEDRNGNGTYEWDTDIPGRPGADQTLWYVANDLDSARVALGTGSRPVGMEMRRTIWGYRNAGWLDNAVFMGTTLINRSGARIDSMFFAQWADPDLGNASDDYVGCDTARQIGYAYNGFQSDVVYGYQAPAFGAILLQGPRVVSPGDTAIMFGMQRPGYRNQRMYAFPLMMKSSSIYGDPLPTSPEQWYLDMNGYAPRTGLPYADPVTGELTKICFAGDPVTGQGWNDGLPAFYPGDRRFMISVGPFAMADGDTQEVILAHIGAQDENRLSSILRLRSYAEETHAFYRRMFQGVPPGASATVQYPSATEAAIAVTADCRREKYSSVSAALTSPGGATVAEFPLYDDGTHGDATAGDGLFSGSATLSRQPVPLSVKIELMAPGGQSIVFNDLADGLVTAGTVLVTHPAVFSDNINSDGIVNQGENVRYGFTVTNQTPFMLNGVEFRQMIQENNNPTAGIDSLAAGSSRVLRYDPLDARTYLSFTATGQDIPQHVQLLPLTVSDAAGNIWRDTVSLPIEAVAFRPLRDTLAHVRGGGTGSFELLVVDPSLFRGHTYSVLGVDSINSSGDPGFSLVDVTGGETILLNHPLPDSLGHTVPVTDGFKILRGSTVVRSGRMSGYQYPGNSPNWTNLNVANVLGLEGFGGTIGNATEHWYSGGAGYRRQHSVLIRFAPTDSLGVLLRGTPYDSLASFAYRYVLNADRPPARPEFAPFIKNPAGKFAYQEYSPSLPFAAYDIGGTPPRRLMVGHLENNVLNGTVDGQYWPPVYSAANNSIDTGPREWFFVFDVPYSQTPDPSLAVDISSVHVPLMWIGYPARSRARGFSPKIGDHYNIDAFQIESQQAPGSGDMWTITLRREEYLPASYALSQNFPNPFNPNTTIRYTLAFPGSVTLTVFNVLGQRVRTLVNQVQYAGEYSVAWDGRNDAGLPVSSGVYIYQLDARPTNGVGESTLQVRKMMLVR